MNRRILKKLSKKAVPILLKNFGIQCEICDEPGSVEVSRRGWPRHQFGWGKRETRKRAYVDLLPHTPEVLTGYGEDSDSHPAWTYLLMVMEWEYAIDRPSVSWDGPVDPFIFPDLSTPAKVFALLKTDPPKKF